MKSQQSNATNRQRIDAMLRMADRMRPGLWLLIVAAGLYFLAHALFYVEVWQNFALKSAGPWIWVSLHWVSIGLAAAGVLLLNGAVALAGGQNRAVQWWLLICAAVVLSISIILTGYVLPLNWFAVASTLYQWAWFVVFVCTVRELFKLFRESAASGGAFRPNRKAIKFAFGVGIGCLLAQATLLTIGSFSVFFSLLSGGIDPLRAFFQSNRPALITLQVAGELAWPIPAIIAFAFMLHDFRRLRQGRCLICGFDLRGDLDSGCPECGWRRMIQGDN